MERCDAIVATGEGTGISTDLEKIKTYRAILGDFPLIVGAGMTAETAREQLSFADGAIVGSYFKEYGEVEYPVDESRVKRFMGFSADEINKNIFSGGDRYTNSCSLEERLNEISHSYQGNLLGYLRYPNDPIMQVMFGPQMKVVSDQRCGYQFMLYTGIADTMPEIKQHTPSFDLNETHIFWKPGSPSWCSVSTLKTHSVKTSNLKSWVESHDRMGLKLGVMTPFLNLPSQWKAGEYRRVKMYYLGENADYNKLHGFEEAHSYCHVFYLGGTLYKKFILCAKKDTVSWKIECTFPSEQEALSPTDTVAPGQTLGSFFPVE